MAAASVASFIPPFRLHLDADACLISSSDDKDEQDQDEMEGSPMDLFGGVPWLRAPPPLPATLPPSFDVVVIPDDDDQKDEMNDSEWAPPALQRKRSTSEALTFTTTEEEQHHVQKQQRTTWLGGFGLIRGYKEPKHPRHCLAAAFTRLANRDDPWVMSEDQLAKIEPPTPPEGMRVYKPQDYISNTELLGKYLIRRGFSIVGVGKSTLVFLISKTRVAKVALYCRMVDEAAYESHRKQRSFDVLHYTDHPEAFAATTYHWVTVPICGILFPWRQELYLQELLEPLRLAPGTEPDFAAYRNYEQIFHMRSVNIDTPFKQWGVRPGSSSTTTKPDLLCYDYQ